MYILDSNKAETNRPTQPSGWCGCPTQLLLGFLSMLGREREGWSGFNEATLAVVNVESKLQRI